MLRLSNLSLPLDHPLDDIGPAICKRLGIAERDLVSWTIARRAHDARKKAAILMVYTVDIALRDEAAVLERFANDSQVRVRPDTDYRLTVKAPEGFDGPRPVVIGAGPCGLFAGLILAQMGLSRSSWTGARWCASGPRTPGVCGAGAS